MKTRLVNLKTISSEETLRTDFVYHNFFSNKENKDNTVPFEELFEICAKKYDYNRIDGTFKYCQIGDVDKSGEAHPVYLNFEERSLLDESYYKKIEKGDIIKVKENDILISFLLPQDVNVLGKIFRITNDITDVFFTNAFICLTPKKMPEILCYLLRGVFYNNLVAVSRIRKGYTGYATLDETDLKKLKFNNTIIKSLLKNYSVIKDRILTVERDIRNASIHLETTSDIIERVFDNEFGFDYNEFNSLRLIKKYSSNQLAFSNNPALRFSAKFHRNAGGFVMKQLTDITDKKIKNYLAEPIVLGASISPGDYSEDGEYQYISMATIKNWIFDSESANYVSKEYSDSKVAKTVRKNDIILARSGEGTIGKVALIDDDNVNGVFADFTMRIRLKDYNPEFAYYYFRTSYFQYLIEIYKKGLGNNTNIFPIVIQDFPLIDISLDEQQRIVDEIHSEIAKQEDIKKQIADLRNQIDCIIEDAITKGDE